MLSPSLAADTAAPPPRQQLEQILQRPLYQRWRLRQERAQISPRESEMGKRIVEWIKTAVEWVVNKLRNWFPSGPMTPSAPGGSWSVTGILSFIKTLGWLALAAIVIAVAILVYRALRGMERGAGKTRVLSRDQVRQALEEGQALALDTPEWLREADRLARERDPRAVYRALYLALLSGLHKVGKIDFRKNRTNWVYVRRYQGPEGEVPVFTELTEMFDSVWYGLRPAEASLIDEVKNSIGLLLAQPASRGEA